MRANKLMCVKCAKLHDITDNTIIEIISGRQNSIFFCKECYEAGYDLEGKPKSINTPEVSK